MSNNATILSCLTTRQLAAGLNRRGFTDDEIAAMAGVEPDVTAWTSS